MTISWWRSWHGAPTDHKWQVIAARSGVKVGIVSAVAWALLDYASQHEERGTVDGFDTEMYAVYSGFDETEIVAVLKAMQDKGVIVNGRLVAWEKRQPKREDDSAERVARHRELKRNVTQSNAPDTDTDKDTDKDTESPAAAVFSSYEKEIGNITPFISDEIGNYLDSGFPEDWFIKAFSEAAAHNARNWKYVKAILDRWKVEGVKDSGSKNGNGNRKLVRKLKDAYGVEEIHVFSDGSEERVPCKT